MAEEQSGQERTEQPTERRLQEARKKGQVPRSRELNTMLSLLFAATGLLVMGPSLVDQFFALTTQGWSFSREMAFNPQLLAPHLMYMIFSALEILMPFFLLAIVAAFAGPIVMGGWSFAPEAMAPKFEKLDPIKGLGRVFSLKGLLEMVKALIKFFLLLSVTVLLFNLNERTILSLGVLTPGDAAFSAVNMLIIGLLALSSAMLFIVAFDVPFELWNHNRQLKMTRQEVRDEMKETDGRPEVKQKIRNLQREASQRKMMLDVPTADVVITNPTHYAVALSYAETKGGAPTVVAKGKDHMAFRIRSVASEHDVPIFEAPPLARALYGAAEIGDEIPQALYLAVAKVLAYLFQLRQALPTDYVPKPDVSDIPADFEVPEDAKENDHGDR